MKSKALAAVLTATLTLAPLIVGCSSTGAANSGASSSSATQSETSAAPVLDGKWRQVGHAEGENGMFGAIDGDAIALWIRGDGTDYIYWYGTFEAPKDSSAYTWTSKANKGNMMGPLSSQDDTMDFSYENGKISLKVNEQEQTIDVTMEQISEEAGLLEELKSGEGAAPEFDAVVQDLQLVDSGYVVSKDGNVEYAVAIKNPNEKYAAQSVKINVVGRGADGTVKFSDDCYMGATLPGATVYCATQAGDGNFSEGDTLEFKVSVDEGKWYQTSEKYDFYQIENVSTSTNVLDLMETTGEITLLRDVTLKGTGNAASPNVVCVLKNAEGKLITGYTSYTVGDLTVGEKKAFNIRNLSGPVEYATAEVYAIPGMQ